MRINKNSPGTFVVWAVEFIQNLPLSAAFTFGFAYFSSGRAGLAAAWLAAGVTAGALLIRYTEPVIDPDEIERPAETLANLIFFSLSIAGFILYFNLNSGSWLVDLALSTAAGAALGLIQARAAGERVSLRHTAALTASFAAAVSLIRIWALKAHPLIGALALTAAVTTVIVVIDYLRERRD